MTKAPTPIARVMVAGSGVMGLGIAEVFAKAGFDTAVYRHRPKAGLTLPAGARSCAGAPSLARARCGGRDASAAAGSQATAAVRVGTPSLVRTDRTWDSTVFAVMPSRRAISAVVRPPATSRMTSRSRRVTHACSIPHSSPWSAPPRHRLRGMLRVGTNDPPTVRYAGFFPPPTAHRPKPLACIQDFFAVSRRVSVRVSRSHAERRLTLRVVPDP